MEATISTPAATDAVTDDELVGQWLQRFERALRARSRADLTALFMHDCHWRDLLAFTWDIIPHQGQTAIVDRLIETQADVHAAAFRIAKGRTPPRRINRVGIPVIEAIFSFETKTGRGVGLLRLPQSDPSRAWVMMTSLQELKGYEPAVGDRRPGGSAYSREFGGANWTDRRAKEQAFDDREPDVLIVGASQTGLSVAARLRLLGVDALCVDALPRVGDAWRRRYHSLALHNQVALNHMAYMPFPASWPKYLAKDMLANWIETYAWAMECNVWTSTSFVGAAYDDSAGHWNATVRRADGTERVLKPRHVIFANGIVGSPRIPKLPGINAFNGVVQHTHYFTDGAAWRGKRAIVVGTGTSGHDIAQDLFRHGAQVKMVQRGSITVVSVESACLAYGPYYEEGIPTEDSDLISVSASYPLAVRGAQLVTKKQREMDKPLLDRLEAKGFKLDFGEDETGYLMKVRRTHSGYYLNCGASELIADGDIGLIQNDDIERFVEDGVLMTDGTVERADLIVMATGYESQQEVVRELLGHEVADRVGPIWGLDEQGELSNMYKPTAQKGLWFLGSGLSQARVFSHYVALQIKAREVGIVS
ncbi:NAD(P)/FAD-dependent oxidoreductase [Paraburkholderia sp. MM5384-R2]|uniref:flavin-containing monooxygenase n=1 Tax=Paraburkholderia sp. MM5384-R2 TaxID=2723097 RepID=UPI001622ACCB|nr:NAD(P)/FAD-dependent oxidoreductase [Paraburkholderia sp. MM5384-R2]MBB5498811.1 putative flavoprotein involved in K+ transport [Paraburkholderia sp. MM5384-R2]